MSKFGLIYGARAAGRNSYLDYNGMKGYLHTHEQAEADALLGMVTYNASFLGVFFEEIARVDQVFLLRLSAIQESFQNFQQLAGEFANDSSRDKRQKKVREATLKRNATKLFKRLNKLEDYRLLNRTAAIKILMKYDKLAVRHEITPLFQLHMDRVNTFQIGHGNALTELKSSLVQLYAELFCDGELEEAQLKLTLSKIDTNPEVLQSVALKSGIIVALMFILLHNCIVAPQLSMLFLLGSDPSVYVYGAVGALITYRWFWGFSVYMWDSVGVDYVLVLSLDPNKHMPTYADIWSDAGTCSVLYLLNVLVFHLLRFYHRQSEEIDGMHLLEEASEYAWVLPVALVIGAVLRLTRSYMHPTSYGVFSTYIASRLARTPFMNVFLRDNFAANILTSFTKVWSATLYGGCYFATGAYHYSADPSSVEGAARYPLCTTSTQLHMTMVCVQILPLLIRFLQCLRQRRDSFLVPGILPPAPPAVDYTDQPRLEDTLTLNLAEHAELLSRSHLDQAEEEVKQEFEGTDVPLAGIARSSSNDSDSTETPFIDPTVCTGFLPRRPSAPDLANDFTEDNTESKVLLGGVWTVAQLARGALQCVGGVLRVMWVWPHSFNALRYFLNITVVVFGAFPPQSPLSVEYMCWYIPLYVVSTIYTSWWDVIVDYQLLQFNCEKPLLRKKLYFDKMEWFYYFVIIVNPILRFFWTLSFTPYGAHPFFVVFEIARRSFWAVLRMEVAYIHELNRGRTHFKVDSP